MARGGAKLAIHRVQLATIFLSSVAARRRPRSASDEDGPILRVRRAELRNRAEDGLAFDGHLSVSLLVPVLDDETFELRLSAAARFESELALSRHAAREFVADQSIRLIWPFARSYVDVIARLAGVSIPLLPTLAVGGPVEDLDPEPDLPEL